MNSTPRGVFRGALIVAGRDLRANARGLKVWLISGLTLLIILGAAFGIAGLVPQGPTVAQENVLWPATAWPANNTTAGIVVWMSDYLGTPKAASTVLLGNPYPPGTKNPTFVQRSQVVTNATGWAAFPGLGAGNWPLRISGLPTLPDVAVGIPPRRPTVNLTVSVQRFDLLGDGALRDASLQALWIDGRPAAGAAIAINGTPAGATDANGFFHQRFEDGDWNVTLTYRGVSLEQDFSVRRSPFAVLPALQGPDALLLFLGVDLIGLFAPIVAIAMSYDAVAKERMQGSLELLLARPASRTGIAVGKFLGSFLSVGLPMLGVLLGAIAGVAGSSGKWPDLTFAPAFVVGTLGLIAVYVLIMQIFSTLAKSAGTAILSAIVVWLLFNLVWNLVFLAVSTVLQREGGTPASFTLNTITLLFNPNGVYQLVVLAFVPSSVLGLFSTTEGGELPNWAGPVAMLIWIAVLLVIAVYVFRKRIV